MSIDFNVLNELKEIMEDDFDELISVFESDAQVQIENLKAAIDTSNAADVRCIAHTIKGSSANLGLTDLSECCRVLEFEATENSLVKADVLLEKIIKEYDVIITTLADNYK
ncbi:MAG: Hpt domain-containing protein [Gammaproteobacteria bacterium]|nr:Hpt domain-containing protein [Gammaproteobacteria bacterium]